MSGGVGEFLMRKMGWKTGEGLGRNREGTVEPIVIDFKVDRKGTRNQVMHFLLLSLDSRCSHKLCKTVIVKAVGSIWCHIAWIYCYLATNISL